MGMQNTRNFHYLEVSGILPIIKRGNSEKNSAVTPRPPAGPFQMAASGALAFQAARHIGLHQLPSGRQG
jgi:hypothetical protein